MTKRNRNHFISGAFIAGALSLAAMTNGCSDTPGGNPLGGLCCDDFKVGADFSGANFGIEDAKLAGQFRAYAQVAGDLSAVATGILTDVGAACRNMAVDFGATNEEIATADKAAGSAQVKAYCELAKAKIVASASGSGTLAAAGVAQANLQSAIKFDPPRCEFNASFQAKCEGGCTGKAECQVKPGEIEARCDPGELSVKCEGSCTGSCEGSVQAAASCEGECSASCEGACEASATAPSIQCDGTCTGECEGSCSVAKNGTSCGGTCSGGCKGKCEARPGSANIKCEGKCTGKCTGSCKFAANATLKCDAQCKGGCSGTAKAPKCTGKVKPPEANCSADVDCKANCEASGSARGNCTPPQVIISVNLSASASAEVRAAAQLQLKSLETNLPLIVGAIKGRIPELRTQAQGFVSGSGKIIGSFGDISGEAKLCLLPIGAAVVAASENLVGSVEAAASVGAVFSIN